MKGATAASCSSEGTYPEQGSKRCLNPASLDGGRIGTRFSLRDEIRRACGLTGFTKGVALIPVSGTVIVRQSTELSWTWDGKTIELGADISGGGSTVLLLPALSSISTRARCGRCRIL
jgi:hypothetical protein